MSRRSTTAGSHWRSWPFRSRRRARLSRAIGAQGAVGAVDRWTSFREFVFESNRADIQASDYEQGVRDRGLHEAESIAPNRNRRLHGSRGTDPRNQDLSDRRISAVRDALIQAGVPSSKDTVGRIRRREAGTRPASRSADPQQQTSKARSITLASKS